MDYIKSLHEGWSDEVMTVLDATPPDSVEQIDLYDRPPELLRSWADGNVVLMGDAVHPMMPNLGQVRPSIEWNLSIAAQCTFHKIFRGILTLIFHTCILYPREDAKRLRTRMSSLRCWRQPRPPTRFQSPCKSFTASALCALVLFSF